MNTSLQKTLAAPIAAALAPFAPKGKPTKAQLVRALIVRGFTTVESRPPSLRDVAPSVAAGFEALSLADYIIADNDFGGCWNDADQITMHTTEAAR